MAYRSDWIITDEAVIELDKWLHVVWTYDGTTAHLYVNAEDKPINSGYATGALGTNDNPLYVGVRGAAWGWFKGKIDEVRTYNRALSPSEVKREYELGALIYREDPLITLYSTLKNNWSFTGDLAKENIRFSTGWYEEAVDLPQITVTEVSTRDEPFQLGYGVVRDYGLFQVDCWVKTSRATGKGPGKAKDWKFKMREEVKRILKANLTGLTDLKYVVLDQTGRSLDELSHSPPILRYSLQVSVIYDI